MKKSYLNKNNFKNYIIGRHQRKTLPSGLKFGVPTMDAFGSNPELDSKTFLLKTLDRRVTEHGAIKLVWTWKLLLFWLAFTVLKGAMHASGGEK